MYRRTPSPARSPAPHTLRHLLALAPLALAALVWASALARPAAAQGAPRGVVEGTVVDDSTSEPQPGVTVIVVGTQRGALTDDRGRVVFGDMPAGDQLLRARALRYRQRDVSVVVRAGETTHVTIRLTAAPVTLGAVRARARPPER